MTNSATVQPTLVEAISKMTLVIGNRTVESICIAAACSRISKEYYVEYRQAPQVGKAGTKPAVWGDSEKALFIGCPLNLDEKYTMNGLGGDVGLYTMVDYLKEFNARHTILGQLDVLDAPTLENWKAAFTTAGQDFDSLKVQPQVKKGNIRSIGKLLLSLLGDKADSCVKALCKVADQAARKNFSSPVGALVQKMIQSDLVTDRELEYLVRWLKSGGSKKPNFYIQCFIGEYNTDVQLNHITALQSVRTIGNGILEIDARGKEVDVNHLLAEMHKNHGAKIATVIIDRPSSWVLTHPSTPLGDTYRSISKSFELEGLDLRAMLNAIRDRGVNGSRFSMETRTGVSPVIHLSLELSNILLKDVQRKLR